MKHKLSGQKIHPRVKLIFWFQITKTQQTKVNFFFIKVCNTTCQRFRQGLQLCVWKLFNQNLIVCENFWSHKVDTLITWKHLKFSRFPFKVLEMFTTSMQSLLPNIKYIISKINNSNPQVWAMVNLMKVCYSWFIHAPFWFQVQFH
jgi:hypothetical protein